MLYYRQTTALMGNVILAYHELCFRSCANECCSLYSCLTGGTRYSRVSHDKVGDSVFGVYHTIVCYWHIRILDHSWSRSPIPASRAPTTPRSVCERIKSTRAYQCSTVRLHSTIRWVSGEDIQARYLHHSIIYICRVSLVLSMISPWC